MPATTPPRQATEKPAGASEPANPNSTADGNRLAGDPCAECLDTLANLLDKLEALCGCNEHDLHGEHILPEITAARALLAKAGLL